MSDPPHSPDPAPTGCERCASMGMQEFASQKGGWEDHDTFLPPAWKDLELVRDFRPHDPRAIRLLRCADCGAWFLYRTTYEYLAGGSEDEQWLFRLNPGQVTELLSGNLEGLPEI